MTGVIFAADGNTIAYRNKFYSWSGSSWDQVGQSSDVVQRFDVFPFNSFRNSLSADFSTIALADQYFAENTGQVRVYGRNGNSWEQIDVAIDGEIEGDQSGTSVSLSADGRTIAIGAPGNNNSNGINAGHVRVYQLTP